MAERSRTRRSLTSFRFAGFLIRSGFGGDIGAQSASVLQPSPNYRGGHNTNAQLKLPSKAPLVLESTVEDEDDGIINCASYCRFDELLC